MFNIIKEQKAISELIHIYENTRMDLSPRYQRTGGIWTLNKEQLLIDSIFNQIDLPKFYLHIFPKEKNENYKYAVVDGKQRILAIMKFYRNEFPLRHDFQFWTPRDTVDVSGLYFKDILSKYPRIAGMFLSFTLDFTIIDTDETDRIKNMFIRINEGVKVTPAEKRNAFGGKLIDSIADACNSNPFFKETIVFNDYRKAYQELFLKLFILEINQGIVDLNESNINNVLESRKDCLGEEMVVIDTVSKQLTKISRAFGSNVSFFKKNNIILYYWFLHNDSSIGSDMVKFIRDFEANRKTDIDPDIQRFNELSRQGLYKKRNMEERLEILRKKYDIYI